MSESGEKNNMSGSDVENKTDAGKSDAISLDLDLDFAPSWARTSPEEHIKTVKNSRFDGGNDSYDRRDGRRSRRDSWRDGNEERFNRRERDSKRGDRKPRRRDGEPDSFQKSKFRREESAFEQYETSSGAASSESGFNGRPQESRNGGDRGGFRGRPRVEHPPLPIEVRVLPEQKALGGVIRRIQSSHRAFPLRDIAWLFLDKPASCLIRLAQQKDSPIPLFQCKVCGMPALSEEEIQNHVLNRHLDEFFKVEDVECEPPGGQFVCVMRCGMTGVLLGPPNHHSFNTKVHEMLRTKFPNMPEEAYRRKIESVREAEVIEEWRQSCTRKKIYRRKSVGAIPVAVQEIETLDSAECETVKPEDDVSTTATPAAVAEPFASDVENTGAAEIETIASEPVISAEDNEVKAPPMERDVAELVFKREILPNQYASVKHLVCIASTALQTPSKRLYFAIKDMFYKERRFPTSLFFALRGAFRHRKLYLFRAKEAKGPDFVMQKKPSELDPSHAVDMVKEVIAYIHQNSACTKAEMVRALAGTDETKIKEVLGQLAWLIEKGNVIEYYNDVLSAPLEFPAFRILPGEKKRGGKRSDSVAAAAVAGEEGHEDADVDESSSDDEPSASAALEETPALEAETTESVAAAEVVPAESEISPEKVVAENENAGA